MALGALDAAVQLALRQGCHAFVVAGDLFDTSKPLPQHLAAVQEILARATGGLEVFLMVGNHDQVSDAPGDHALGPLSKVATIVEEPETFLLGETTGAPVELVLVPFARGRGFDMLCHALNGLGDATVPRQLSIHLGVSDGTTPPWLKDAEDSIHQSHLADIALGVGANIVTAGNWHNEANWNPSTASGAELPIHQCGSLCPTGFDDLGSQHGGVVIWDSVHGTEVHHVVGPRFFKCDVDNVSIRAYVSHTRVTAPSQQNYVRFTASSSDKLLQGVRLLGELKRDGLVVDGDVVADGGYIGTAEQGARDAATAARGQETLDEALVAYVGALKVDGVSNQEVLSLATKYLQTSEAP
jgi:hypothetical protein